MSEWQPCRLRNAHGVPSDYPEAESVALKKIIRIRELVWPLVSLQKQCDSAKFFETHPDDIPGGPYRVCGHEVLTD